MMFCVVRGKRAGFTLIEIMIVIAIIAILAGIAIPDFMHAKAEAQLEACMENCQTVGTAMETFLVRHSNNDMLLLMIGKKKADDFGGKQQVVYAYTKGAFSSSYLLDQDGELINSFVELGYLASAPICPIFPPIDGKASYEVRYNYLKHTWAPRPNFLVMCRKNHDGFEGPIRVLHPVTGQETIRNDSWRRPKYVLGMGLYDACGAYLNAR